MSSLMSGKAVEQIIRDRIFRLNGKEAQQLVWDILKQKYPDLQTPTMQKDLGNDGYSLEGKVFFASYFIESGTYDNKETKDKVNGDYKKYEDNWKQLYGNKIGKWVFITKENLMGIPHQAIVALNNINDGIKKEHWGIDALVDICMNLSSQKVRQIFNLPTESVISQPLFKNNGVNNGTQISATNIYIASEDEDIEDFAIIDEIFEYVLKSLRTYRGESEPGYIHLADKIKLNFTKDDDQQAIAEYFNLALTKVRLIELRVQSAENETQHDLQSHIFGKYYELKTKGFSNIDILHELFKEFIPTNKERDSRYINLAKAFVLLYFEDCSIFQKTLTEESK